MHREGSSEMLDKSFKHENETERESESSTEPICGIGRFHPKWLQKLVDMKLYTLNYSIANMTVLCFSTYMVSQITTLEKQFQLSSTESSLFMTINEVGYVIMSVLVTHLARRMHIPRILAVLGFVIGVVGFINSIPHFVMVAKDFPFYEINNDNVDVNLNPFNDATRCHRIGVNKPVANMTSSCENTTQSRVLSVRSMALAVICLGMFISGSAKGPRNGLSISYIDDNVEKSKTGYHLGIVVGVGIFGPALAFGVGAFFNTVYVTLGDTTLTPSDPRWIGAWWLGFIVFGCVTSVVSISLMCFPKTMRKGEDSVKPKFIDEVKDLPRAILRLCKNKIYVVLKLAIAARGFIISGSISFYPKYIELQFHTLPWMANSIFGSAMVTAAALGSLISGIIVSRFKLGVKGCVRLILVVNVAAMIAFFCQISLGCDQIQYHGHSEYEHIYPIHSESQLNATYACASKCGCKDTDFLPVCATDDVTYFSPCHAGCTSTGNQTFENCLCTPSRNQTATPGICEPVCDKLITYAVLSFLANFVSTLTLVPALITNIRVVDEKDKTLSLGFGNIATSLLGWMLGPVIFGRVIDSTCQLWGSNCGERGACSIYNLDDLRIKFHSLIIGASVIALVFYVVVYVFVIRSGEYDGTNSGDEGINFENRKESRDSKNVDARMSEV